MHRLANTRTRKHARNGIGVSIASKIVSLYNGSIQVKSEVNSYTTFSITFNI
ncbi:ATP-binding protein [Staphylococcus carnosus]|uniref:ATP-binding protein n=1 Tax=Staphylococcus carnosus TaxID=1281 RepID=UPI003F999BB9